jgi:tetratricopeptide (TPR) repeat protein
MKNSYITLLAIAIILLIGITGWSMRSRLEKEGTSSDSEPVPISSVTTSDLGNITANAPGIQYGYTAPTDTTTGHAPQGAPVPNLDRPIVIPASFREENAARAKEEIQKLTAALKENPANGPLWGTLGLKRQGVEDYEGAREAYEYALALSPRNGVTAENLGVLYGYYLHEPLKAEKYFRQALDIESLEYRYLRLHDLYKDIMKNTAKTRAILEQGLKEYPRNTSFKTLLESL